MTCKNSCESNAFRIEIRRLSNALLNAAEALDKAEDTLYIHGYIIAGKEAENAARIARSIAMDGPQHQSTIDQLTGHS